MGKILPAGHSWKISNFFMSSHVDEKNYITTDHCGLALNLAYETQTPTSFIFLHRLV